MVRVVGSCCRRGLRRALQDDALQSVQSGSLGAISLPMAPGHSAASTARAPKLVCNHQIDMGLCKFERQVMGVMPRAPGRRAAPVADRRGPQVVLGGRGRELAPSARGLAAALVKSSLNQSANHGTTGGCMQ